MDFRCILICFSLFLLIVKIAYGFNLEDRTRSDCLNVGLNCSRYSSCKMNMTSSSLMCFCVAGFMGLTCEEDRNECDVGTSPCTKRGVCHNSIGSFKCDCLPGWRGRHCERSDGSGLSTCLQGFTGQNCTEDFDECTEWEPCENGGTCHNTRGNFSCICTSNWEGRICNEDVNECSRNTSLCHNGGSCINIPGYYKCDCPYPYTGPACDNIATTTTNTTPLPSTRPTPKLSNLKSSTTTGSVSIPTGALIPGTSSNNFSGQTTNSHSTYSSSVLPNNSSVAQTTGSGQTPGPVGTQGPKPQKQPNSHAEESGGDTNAGAIAGPIVGVLVVAGAAGAGFFVYKKYPRKPNTVDTGCEKSPVTDDSNKNTKPKPEARQTDQNTVEVSADNHIPNGIETVP